MEQSPSREANRMYENRWDCFRSPGSDLDPRPREYVLSKNGTDENCNPLGHYKASSGNSLQTFRDNLSVPSLRVKNLLGFLNLKDGTCIRNYQYSLRSIPEERSTVCLAAEAWNHAKIRTHEGQKFGENQSPIGYVWCLQLIHTVQ